jgi:hypothetical protein
MLLHDPKGCVNGSRGEASSGQGQPSLGKRILCPQAVKPFTMCTVVENRTLPDFNKQNSLAPRYTKML